MIGFLRKGFGKGGNTLITLFVFFIVGLLLHFKGNTRPIVLLWQQLTGAVTAPGISASETIPGHTVSVPAPADVAPELARLVGRSDFVLPKSAARLQTVHHSGFSLGYAERYEQAAWVAYSLTRAQAEGPSSRERLFLPDPKVRTGSAVFADYTRSGFDRGHLAPAADFRNAPEQMKETFYMSNISPQNRDFNAGIWNDLEKLIRSWARRYEKIYVVTGPVLKPGLPAIGRINKVAVPEQFYKVVLSVNTTHVKGIAFLLNNEPATGPLSQFVVSIDSVEKLTGLDFFPLLPDTLETRLEAETTGADWHRLR